MDIYKAVSVTPEDMELINLLAKTPLEADQVYTFAVRLCDNEVDRDFERFDRAALNELAKLFVGKSGIFDHNWSASGQTARLYKAEVVDEPGQTTKAGEAACYLKGWAYMLRTDDNETLIAEIEGGIKREVSVGCSVERAVCSICGASRGYCEHRGGKEYDGRECYFTLKNPTDAYEWSFVAVPAQRKAGVVKVMGGGAQELSEEDVDRIAAKVADRVKKAMAPAKPPEQEGTEVSQRARARLEMEKIRFGGN